MAAGAGQFKDIPGVPDETSPLLGQARVTAETDDDNVEGRDNGQDEAGEDSPAATGPTFAKLIVILTSMWIGTFLSAADSTIVATLGAPISASFNSFTALSWLATSYTISAAAIQPLSGKLTDIYGRRTGLILANLAFAIGTLMCGLAKTEGILIVGRVLAGAGGGCVNTISVFVTTDFVPLRKRGLYQGLGNLFFGVGSALGGVFGGWVSDGWGWRWAFLIQVPCIVVSGIIVAIMVKVPIKETNKSKIRRVDFLGAITLSTTLILLLLGLNSGGNVVPWKHPLVYVSIPLSALSLIAFIYVEDRVASEPVIPVRLLLQRTVWSACTANFFGSMVSYSLFYYIPIYYQIRGYSSSASGARLIPQCIGLAVGSLSAGYLMRATGTYWWWNVGYGSVFVASTALMVGIMREETPAGPPFVLFSMAGIGYGAMLTITLLALISGTAHEQQAVITSASYAFRSTGSTLGITISGAVFQNVAKAKLWDNLGYRKHAAEMIGRIRNDIGIIQDLPKAWREGAVTAYIDALKWVWITMLLMTIVMFVSSLFMREHKLHTNLQRK